MKKKNKMDLRDDIGMAPAIRDEEKNITDLQDDIGMAPAIRDEEKRTKRTLRTCEMISAWPQPSVMKKRTLRTCLMKKKNITDLPDEEKTSTDLRDDIGMAPALLSISSCTGVHCTHVMPSATRRLWISL